MRINKAGLQYRDDGIISVVLDELFDRVWEETSGRHDIEIWAYRHEDGVHTLHWSVDGVHVVSEAVQIDPMPALARPQPFVKKIIDSLGEVGVA